ncbi:PREDICTED: uncharacterized protein LOC104807875 [Tarenaya hassleriana]|uniref:uncharacterized protein LOC104807875 n=1 Tax=Tarenaya hassleriana TaxID=28532 RepID=UPI00053C69FB|nr:PREDICTED: uncharacterized protein LOC104807875 [Tarenaya hassleriana]
MRKVIAIDATSLKTSYKGFLIVATAQDGNRHLYPLAWGIVDTENDASWNWFMRKLAGVIPDSDDMVLISDRHQSIANAIRDVYRRAKHAFCAYYISQNIKTLVNKGVQGKKNKNGESVAGMFYKCAECYTEKEFLELWEDFCERSVEPVKWARCYFPGERYNLLTTNGAESINSVLKKARTLPLLGLLDVIVDKTIEWWCKHRACAFSSTQELTPEVHKELHRWYRTSKAFSIREINRNWKEYEVTEDNGKTYFVDLGKKCCDCKVWDVDKYPCSHAIKALHEHGDKEKLLEYCSSYYTRATWELAYVDSVYPVSDISHWEIPDHIAELKVDPPAIRDRRVGRPMTNRIKSAGEKRIKKRKSRLKVGDSEEENEAHSKRMKTKAYEVRVQLRDEM